MRWAWSLLLSFACVPWLVFIISRSLGPKAALLCIVALNLVAVWGVARLRLLSGLQWKKKTLLALFAWAAVVLFMLVDLPWHGRLYVSVPVFDHSYRVAFVESLAKYGIPAVNPLYFPGSQQPLRYYYFWYAVLALPVRFLGLEPRAALIASCVFCGFALVACLALYARYWFRDDRLVRYAVPLLAVTGLDILPTLANLATGVPMDADMEWWSTDQVTSWMDTLLWVPHHCAGLISLMFALLLLWIGREEIGWKRFALSCVAGIALASTAGLSIYLGIMGAILLASWCVWLVWSQRGVWHACSVILAGLVAILVSIPYVMILLARGASGSAAEFPLRFGIREMIHADVLLRIPAMQHAAAVHPMRTLEWIRAVLLVPGYFVELGIFGVGMLAWMISYWRSRSVRSDAERSLIFLMCIAALVATLLRSTAISNNDFGYRSILVLQFLLVLGTAAWLQRWVEHGRQWHWRSILCVTMLGIGVASTMYQMVVLRSYTYFHAEYASTAYQVRQAYQTLQARTTQDAVVLWDEPPAVVPGGQPATIAHLLHLLYAGRQAAVVDMDCGVPFGGNASLCAPLLRDVHALYRGQGRVDAETLCRRWGIQYFVTMKRDPIWENKTSWVWHVPAVAAEPAVRILPCDTP